MAGNSLSLSGLNQGGNLDFDEDDTPRFMNLEEQVYSYKSSSLRRKSEQMLIFRTFLKEALKCLELMNL